jgi:hypothetical protein
MNTYPTDLTDNKGKVLKSSLIIKGNAGMLFVKYGMPYYM